MLLQLLILLQLILLILKYDSIFLLKYQYFFSLDFYLPDLKLVIECNGDYWHNLPDKIKRDKQLKKYVESTGRKIIFIWEHEINDDWFWIGDFIEEVMQNA